MVPAGFRFRPTEEELINLFLLKKVRGEELPWDGIPDGDLYGEKAPWEMFGDLDELEDKHYLFTKLKKVKSRVTRLAGCGTWHLSCSHQIYEKYGQQVIGCNKLFSFKAKQGSCPHNSNWIMHEFSLAGISLVGKQEQSSNWVLCTILEKGLEKKRRMNQNMSYGVQVFNTQSFTNELQPREEFRESKKMRYNVQPNEVQATEMPLCLTDTSQVTPSTNLENFEEDIEVEDNTRVTDLETYVSYLPSSSNFVENNSLPADSTSLETCLPSHHNLDPESHAPYENFVSSSSSGPESESPSLDSWWENLVDGDFFDIVFV